MLPLPKLPEQRANMEPLPRFHIVTPSGQLKGVPFERNVESPLIQANWKVQQGRRVALISLAVRADAVSLGYSSLEELYEAEDRAEDFLSYLKWYEKANAVEGVAPIDDEYLPDEVLRRRKVYIEELRKVDLPAPKRGRKPKADSAEGEPPKPPKTAKRRKAARVKTGS